MELFKKSLKEYKDFLLFCYDNGIIDGNYFFYKLDCVQRLEKYVK